MYSIALALQEIKPDIIFHLAYDTEDLSGSIVEGTKDLLLARTATNVACRFIYLSTDAVFDGGFGPYREYDVPTPIAGPKALSRYDFAKKLAHLFGCETEGIPKGLLSESGIIHPRDVSLDVTLAEKILKTKMRSVEEVGKWRQAESM